MLVNLYALSDPRSPHEFRYVGRTIKEPAERLKGHIQEAMSRRADGTWRNAVTHKHAWIRALARDGYRPVAVPLSQCEHRNQVFTEQQLIAALREAGHQLTNATNGGEGPHLYKATEQTRQRQSEGGRRRYENNPAEREFYRQQMIRQFGSAEGRRFLSEQALRQWSTPEARQAQSDRLKAVCADPDHMARRSASMRRTLMETERGQRIRAANSKRLAGEGNHFAKLSWPQVREIRARYADGGVTHVFLAADYGVTPSLIQQIVNCRIWTDDPTGIRPTPPATRRPPAPRLTVQRCEEIAEVYRSAIASGQPSQAVARHFSVDPVRAYGWIATARRRGHLGPTTPGMAGEVAP